MKGLRASDSRREFEGCRAVLNGTPGDLERHEAEYPTAYEPPRYPPISAPRLSSTHNAGTSPSTTTPSATPAPSFRV